MSHIKKSGSGCRSGNSGERSDSPSGCGIVEFAISHTRLSQFHTLVNKFRHFTHRVPVGSSKSQFAISHTKIRNSTHLDSQLHTPQRQKNI